MRIRAWGAAGLTILTAACATTRYEEYGPPPEGGEVGPAVESVTVSQDQLLAAQVRAIEGRVAELEVLIAARLGAADSTDVSLAAQIAALTGQIEALRKQLGADQPPAAPAPLVPPPPPKPLDANLLYEQALQAFDRQEYGEARRLFNRILTQNPAGQLADNAQYWLGECAYAVEDYTGALEAFKRVFQFTETEKDDDAQLKLGYCYLKLGDADSALIEFKRLTVDYPQSEYLARAEEQIRRIRAAKASGP